MQYSKTRESYDHEGIHWYHITTIPCPKAFGGCGETEEISVRGEDLFRYNQGVHIQDAFPDLTIDERERLLTGFCSNCYNKIFKED